MIYETQTYSFNCFEAGERSRPTLLFLHGFLGKGSDWAGVAGRLSNEFYCVAPDLPGHGQTHVRGGDELFTIESTAHGLHELVQQLGTSLYGVIGYSMGGRLALYFAATFPHSVRRLVLESASPGLRTEEEQKARRQHDEALAQRLENTPFDEFLDGWYNQPLFASLRAHPAFDRILAQRRINTPAGLARSLRQMGTGSQPSMWETLASLPVPTVLLAGQRDEKFVRIGREMTEILPSAPLCVIAGAGHTLHVENEDVYTDVVRTFLTAPGIPESI